MANQARTAAIVGIYEWPKRVDLGVSAMQIKAASISRALEDAGLSWSDVDGLYDANDGEGGGGLGMAAYLGIKPTVIDTTSVGGSSYEFLAAHALADIAAGKCKVAVMAHGGKTATHKFATGNRFAAREQPPSWQSNMEAAYRNTTVSSYALVAARHMYEYGTRPEDLAEISATTRYHAMRNPDAVQGMIDLKFEDVREITVDDVLNSRMIASPLHLLECCLISDGGGAAVIASADVARNTRKQPVWIIGSGQATKYRENGGDITVSAAAQSGPIAFGEAQLSPEEMDIAMIYDSFTITVACLLEDLGFCKKGEFGDYVRGGRLRFDRPGAPALNTDGGALSSNHPGFRGLFLLMEATRQLRGESTSQVPGAKLAVAHGNGGLLGHTHAGGTIVLAAD